MEEVKKDGAFIASLKRNNKQIREDRAAADMLNSNIIARELGLSDKVQNEHTGANGKPLIPSAKEMTTDDHWGY